jgi:hypothetical protein
MMLADLVLEVGNLDTMICKFTIMEPNFTILLLSNSALVVHNVCVVLADLVLAVGNLGVLLDNLVMVVSNFKAVVAILIVG